MSGTAELIDALRAALEPFDEIAFAVLFGSAATGRLRLDSDLDIAVYGASGRSLEIELDRELVREIDMQIAAERVSGRNVDLLILNRAPAAVCTAAITSGISLFIRDESLYSRYLLAVMNVAIDFRETEREWREIRSRSASLSPVDRNRLERILAFLEDELRDAGGFQQTTLKAYQQDRALRRNLDRWVEILSNSMIDIAKIVLASENMPAPQTYAQILELLPSVSGFASIPREIATFAALRNVMAHEYLDLRFNRVKRFVQNDVETVRTVMAATRTWMESPQ